MQSIIDGLRSNGFATIDYVVFFVYLAVLIFLGFFLSRSKKGEEKSSKDYFLAGNTLTWWAVGASLIAANISAEQFIGMSGSAFNSGIAMAAYELMAAATLLVVGKFLLPLMIEKKVFTIPQFLRDRYNDGVGLSFSIFWLFLYVFINLTSVAWLGALAIKQILGLPAVMGTMAGMSVDFTLLTIILILFLVAGLYSIYGGLASVAWTDVMQVTFLVGGGLITAYAALDVIGSELHIEGGALGAFSEIYSHLGSIDGDKHFNLVVTRNEDLYPMINGVKDASGAFIQKPDPYFDIPGIVVIVGALWLTNLGYWGFNQYIIQKGLAAKNIDEAKKGLIFAGFLKLLIPFIVVLPGICAYYIAQNPEVFANMHLAGKINVADDAYPWLIRNFTPTGVKGLSFAALAAAIISSLASMFNSTSTLFTMDIYKKYINKNASDKKLVNVGRLTSLCALIIAAVAVKPLLGGLDQAFQYIQEYSGFIYPGIVVVFGLGLLWRRASSKAAVWTAIITIPLGVLFKIFLGGVWFQLRAGYVFIILVVFFVLMSLLDKKYVSIELPAQKDCATMIKWAKILGGSGLFFIIAAFTVIIWGACLPESCTPENNFIAYLNDIGFQAFIFFGVLVGCQAIWLYSNAKDKKADPKALAVDLTLFHTNKGYNIGAFLICAIVAVLYVILW